MWLSMPGRIPLELAGHHPVHDRDHLPPNPPDQEI